MISDIIPAQAGIQCLELKHARARADVPGKMQAWSRDYLA
jgi:hypothetical protein